jgi:hypothetical protein
MTKKVYNLKHATPNMKYQHMRAMMEFKEDLKDNQREAMTPMSRQWMIEQIKAIDPNFRNWFDKVYKLRADGNMAEYEKAIREKYNSLTQPAALAHSPFDFREQEYDETPPTDAAESARIQARLSDNVVYPADEQDCTQQSPTISGGDVYYPQAPSKRKIPF